MPRYDYSCAPCDMIFEVSRSFSESDLPVFCPVCEAKAVRGFSVPLATFTRGAASAEPLSAPPASAASRWSHFGHSHGSGSGGHSHGGPPAPAAPPS